MGKVTLAIECAVILAAALIVIGVALGPLRSMPWIGLVPTFLAPPALAGLVVTLWMGFRWTIIGAGPEGLRLELRRR